jgi:hypothetical protein
LTYPYISSYNQHVTTTITDFRKNLFNLAEKVIEGESVEFVHKGKTIRLVVPEVNSTRLERLTPRQITNPEMTEDEHRTAERKLQAEMLAEMEKDWADL